MGEICIGRRADSADVQGDSAWFKVRVVMVVVKRRRDVLDGAMKGTHAMRSTKRVLYSGLAAVGIVAGAAGLANATTSSANRTVGWALSPSKRET